MFRDDPKRKTRGEERPDRRGANDGRGAKSEERPDLMGANDGPGARRDLIGGGRSPSGGSG